MRRIFPVLPNLGLGQLLDDPGRIAQQHRPGRGVGLPGDNGPGPHQAAILQHRSIQHDGPHADEAAAANGAANQPMMIFIAGIFMIVGALAVYAIKEKD